MATGWPMKTTYANGDVYSASDVNDITGTINLLTSSTLSRAAGKNAVINGGMDIWQRGTSVAVNGATTGYTADRWQIQSNTASVNTTTTRQATSDTTNLPNIQYCARVQRNSGVTANGFISIQQSFETVSSIPYVGKTITFSFYARAGANYSSSANALGVQVRTGTGTDQNVNSYTGTANPIDTSVTLTTTWQRFTATVAIPTTVTEIGLNIYYATSGTAGTNDYFEITGVQLELGSTATTFSRAGGTIQGELAACQRYYEKSYSQATAPGTATQTGMTVFQNNNSAAGALRITSFFKVTKRTSPNVRLYDGAGTIDKVMYNYTNGYTGTAVPNETSVDVYTDGTTTKNALSYQFTADAEL